MTVIDDHLNLVYTNDSFPIRVGWEYKLMGNGDDYVEVTRIQGKYVTIRGIGDTKLNQTILLTALDNSIKELANTGANSLITEDSLFDISTESNLTLLWK